MKWKLYIKVFLTTGIPFGVVFGLLGAGAGAAMGAVPEIPVSIVQGALLGFLAIGIPSGFLFGALMSAILVTMHFSHSDDPNVRHTRTVFLHAEPVLAWRLCREALHLVEGIQLKTQRPDRIEALKGCTWKSFGDLITCEIAPGDGGQRITIKSRPRVRTTVVDYGSNLANVNTIVEDLCKNGARLLIE